VNLLVVALADDIVFVDSGLARGIFDGPGSVFSELNGCVSATASRGADKSGTGG
jgi:hypothetical protein